MVGAESRVDGGQLHESSHHQTRADQQHEAERDFGDNQNAAHALAFNAAGGSAARIFETPMSDRS